MTSPRVSQDPAWRCAGWPVAAVGVPLPSWAPVVPPPTARIASRTAPMIAAAADQPRRLVLMPVPPAPGAGGTMRPYRATRLRQCEARPPTIRRQRACLTGASTQSDSARTGVAGRAKSAYQNSPRGAYCERRLQYGIFLRFFDDTVFQADRLERKSGPGSGL